MRGPRYTVRLLTVAEDDLNDIVSYIAADRPKAAESLARRIEKNLRLLSINPHLGRVPNDPRLFDLGYRYLVVGNYLIFYACEGRTIYVHRIMHAARDYLGLL